MTILTDGYGYVGFAQPVGFLLELDTLIFSESVIIRSVNPYHIGIVRNSLNGNTLIGKVSCAVNVVGIFKDEDDKLLKPLTLQKTDYLPSLAGVQWEHETKELSFTKEQQLFFKRARIDVIIMKKESDPNTKYELFQRLNTGGSLLSDQEVRNCLMIMTNKPFYEFITELDSIEPFRNCLPISDRRTDEQYRLELLLRLLIPQYIDWTKIGQYTDFAELLDKETVSLCNKELDLDKIKEKFVATFSLLYGVFGEDTFKKYNGVKHLGPVMAASFQAIATGVYENIDAILDLNGKNDWLKSKVHNYILKIYSKRILPLVLDLYQDLKICRYSGLSILSHEN